MSRYLNPPKKLTAVKKTERQLEIKSLLKIWRRDPGSKRGRETRRRLKALGVIVREANVEGLPQMPIGTEFTNPNLAASREGMVYENG